MQGKSSRRSLPDSPWLAADFRVLAKLFGVLVLKNYTDHVSMTGLSVFRCEVSNLLLVRKHTPDMSVPPVLYKVLHPPYGGTFGVTLISGITLEAAWHSNPDSMIKDRACRVIWTKITNWHLVPTPNIMMDLVQSSTDGFPTRDPSIVNCQFLYC